MLSHIFIYLISFAGIWIGSGLAVGSVERLSKTLRISSFAVSFLVLGFFTSISELSVGVNSLIENDPEIFVGNLIGASIVLTMLVIPLLAITGSKINISKEFQGFNLPASLIVIALPVILSIDGEVNRTDSLITITLFCLLVFIIQKKRGLFERLTHISHQSGRKMGRELLKIVFGLAMIFFASHFVVQQTIYFSGLLGVSPFLISLLIISIGTNVPELSFIVRSIFMKSNQVAFGDYVGSATFNTFLMGCLALFYGKPVMLQNSYLISLLFLIVGLSLFYYFARTKNSISRLEGLVLFFLYIAFLATEFYVHRGVFSNINNL